VSVRERKKKRESDFLFNFTTTSLNTKSQQQKKKTLQKPSLDYPKIFAKDASLSTQHSNFSTLQISSNISTFFIIKIMPYSCFYKPFETQFNYTIGIIKNLISSTNIYVAIFAPPLLLFFFLQYSKSKI